MKKNIQPTFLLRCVTLTLSVGVFIAVFKISNSFGFTTGATIFLLAFWFIGIEGGLLPDLLEHLVVRKAGKTAKTSNLWYVHVEDDRRREFREHVDATSNNPTIR